MIAAKSHVRQDLQRYFRYLPLVLAGLFGLMVAAIFRPGFLDGDGLSHLIAARTNRYNDWYPPLISLIPRLAYRLCGTGFSTLELVTTLQAILGAIGVYRLAVEVLTFLARTEKPGAAQCWGGLSVLCVLLTPFTPLMYYLAHYRNDSVVAVCLPWALSSWLHVSRRWRQDEARTDLPTRVTVLAVAVIWSVLALLARYNAIVIVPALLLLAGVVLGRRHFAAAGCAAVILMTAPFLLQQTLYFTMGVERYHPEGQVMALDLVGMVLERNDLRRELPYTSSYLTPDLDKLRKGYVYGLVTPIMPYTSEEKRIVKQQYVIADVAALSREYQRAVRSHPYLWLLVKLKTAQATLLDPIPMWHHHWVDADGHHWIDPNDLGISFRSRFESARNFILEIDSRLYCKNVLRFLCARHLPWFALCSLLTAAALAGAFWLRTRRALIVVAILFAPLAYYLSHLMAVTTHDYRFMWPATLVMQVLTVCIVGKAATLLRSVANRLHQGFAATPR